jgi:hypothetical protein
VIKRAEAGWLLVRHYPSFPTNFPAPLALKSIGDFLEGAILKCQTLWRRSDGVALIAEGL